MKGINWNIGAVGNATWSGARLCDVLRDLGINEDAFNHVQVSFSKKVIYNIFTNIVIKLCKYYCYFSFDCLCQNILLIEYSKLIFDIYVYL